MSAANSEHLKQLLRDDHRHVFTLIQKFRTAGGAQGRPTRHATRFHRTLS
jgi:type I site-specific restriction-modification system R (restriction) subunit